MHRLAEIPCDARLVDICKYAPNCHLSDHHRYPKILGKEAVGAALAEGNVGRALLVRKFIKHNSNVMRVCRRVHDYLDSAAPTELPDELTMQRVIDG